MPLVALSRRSQLALISCSVSPALGVSRPGRLISHLLASHCRRRKLGLLSCSISPSFVLSHNMSMVNTTSNWLCFGAFHPPPVPSLFGIRWLLVTILSPHAPRLTVVGVRRRCRAPSWVRHSPHSRRQHATTCYVFRFWQKFSELSFRRKLLSNIDLRRFLC